MGALSIGLFRCPTLGDRLSKFLAVPFPGKNNHISPARLLSPSSARPGDGRTKKARRGQADRH